MMLHYGCLFWLALSFAWDFPHPPANESITGVWQAITIQANGKHPGREIELNQVWTISNMGITIDYGDGEPQTFSYLLDPATRPWLIDLKDGRRLQNQPGICQLQGDTLIICLSRGNRPETFSAIARGQRVVTFKRKVPAI